MARRRDSLNGNDGPRTAASDPRLEDLRLLMQDTTLTPGARMLMVDVLTTVPDGANAVRFEILDFTQRLGISASDLRSYVAELERGGYIKSAHRDPSTYLVTSRELAEQPAQPSRSAEDIFRETMDALSIPVNLQPHYEEIYAGLHHAVFGYVTPGNRDRIQRIFNRVGAVMASGEVDGRGPTGLIIHMIRNIANVPHRSFDAGQEADGQDDDRTVPATSDPASMADQMDWGSLGSEFNISIPSIPGGTGPDHGPTGAACLTLGN